MAMNALEAKKVSIALACRTFQIRETCYLYERQFDDEKAEIADWLVRSDREPQDLGLWSVFLVSAHREGL